jgi:hypothetical protein
MFRPIYLRRCIVPALCSVSTEQQSIQSNRATEQSVAEQPAGHMTHALLSRVSPLAADCDVCACSAVVPLGVITAAFERTTSKNALLRKEITKARELLQVRKEHKKGKCIAIKRKFVFNM